MATLDLFVGGLPAGLIFKMDSNDLMKIVDSSNDDEVFNRHAEISFIALICYFEAFFKNQFASIINIAPSILSNFAEKRPDICIPIKDLLILDKDFNRKIGFIASEQFDFGTAKIINSLYKDLLLVTPFSKDDIETYNELLSKRNLLVHHGGIYTLKYGRQKFNKEKIAEDVFYNSLVIKKDDFYDAQIFTEKIVSNTTKGCYNALKRYIDINNVILDKEDEEAIDSLLWEI